MSGGKENYRREEEVGRVGLGCKRQWDGGRREGRREGGRVRVAGKSRRAGGGREPMVGVGFSCWREV